MSSVLLPLWMGGHGCAHPHCRLPAATCRASPRSPIFTCISSVTSRLPAGDISLNAAAALPLPPLHALHTWLDVPVHDAVPVEVEQPGDHLLQVIPHLWLCQRSSSPQDVSNGLGRGREGAQSTAQPRCCPPSLPTPLTPRPQCSSSR